LFIFLGLSANIVPERHWSAIRETPVHYDSQAAVRRRQALRNPSEVRGCAVDDLDRMNGVIEHLLRGIDREESQ
jgi:hypothetical protein